MTGTSLWLIIKVYLQISVDLTTNLEKHELWPYCWLPATIVWSCTFPSDLSSINISGKEFSRHSSQSSLSMKKAALWKDSMATLGYSGCCFFNSFGVTEILREDNSQELAHPDSPNVNILPHLLFFLFRLRIRCRHKAQLLLNISLWISDKQGHCLP